MDMNKLTMKSQTALAEAQQQAVARNHQQIEPEHVLFALLGDAEGIVYPLLHHVGANPAQLRAQVGQLQRDLDAKGQELTRLSYELDTARKALEGRRGEADADRGTVAQLRRELDANRQRENAGRGRITDLEKSLTEREARLAQIDRELAAARSAQAAAEQRQSTDASRLAAQTSQLQTQADADRGQVSALRTQLADSRREAGTQTARVAELEKSVAEREASLAAKNKEMDALRASVAKLEGETKDQRERLERLRQQAPPTGTGPVIQIMQPELRTMRDGKNVRALVATDRTVVVGRVTSETELLSLTVNDHAEKLLTNNVFRSDVALATPEQPVRIVAIDKQGRRSTLEFVVARTQPPPATASSASSAPAGATRVGLPRTGAASFGTYYALVIGNNDYQQLRKLKTAVADAREVARVLEQDYGFKVRLLLNATRYDILAGRAQRSAREAHREGQSPDLLRRPR
jgi:predicted  nucleic acid-binding Zn-ribbon protein